MSTGGPLLVRGATPSPSTNPGLDDGVHPVFGEVRVEVTPDGPAPAERCRQLHAAVDEHCPVLDLFRNTTPVTTELAVSG
ncbi:OsmC family protein [Pseudonocardia sediminis]|uniref:OsmC family protein n=1 Tax=Pseudonocardia sediminis TaxID=1397368 RepID=UPI00102A52A0